MLRALLTPAGQFALAGAELSPAGEQMVETAMAALDTLTEQILPLRAQLQTIGTNQPGVLALTPQYGIGLLCGTIIWAELGDCRRFSNADQAVRFAGLDVTVWSSDTRRSAGRLARQGSPELRWALFEAAKAAAHQTSPDHDYYDAVRDRLGGNARRCQSPVSWYGVAITPCASWATRPGWRRHSRSSRRPNHMLTGARLRPIPLMSAAGSRHPPVVAPRSERPGKNERPGTIGRLTPIRHHVAGLSSSSCTQIRLGETAHTSASGLAATIPRKAVVDELNLARADRVIRTQRPTTSQRPLARGANSQIRKIP